MIRIVLIDDHAVVRTGYRRLLDAEPGMQVVGEAASADRERRSSRCRCGNWCRLNRRRSGHYGPGYCPCNANLAATIFDFDFGKRSLVEKFRELADQLQIDVHGA